MDPDRKMLMAGLRLATVMSLAPPMRKEASDRQFKNVVGGAAISAGAGALVGGADSSMRTGAVAGAIAGAVK